MSIGVRVVCLRAPPPLAAFTQLATPAESDGWTGAALGPYSLWLSPGGEARPRVPAAAWVIHAEGPAGTLDDFDELLDVLIAAAERSDGTVISEDGEVLWPGARVVAAPEAPRLPMTWDDELDRLDGWRPRWLAGERVAREELKRRLVPGEPGELRDRFARLMVELACSVRGSNKELFLDMIVQLRHHSALEALEAALVAQGTQLDWRRHLEALRRQRQLLQRPPDDTF